LLKKFDKNLFMPSKNPTSISFTPKAQEIDSRLTPIFGRKYVLSAALELFNALSDTEKIKHIRKIKEEKSSANQSQDLHQAIKVVVRIVSGSGTDIQILPDEYDRLEEVVKEMFGPKESQILEPKKKKKSQIA
jgi:hypothetical protein